MKLRIKEAIVVEGRYDKNTLSQVVDTLILETEGFGIFTDSEKLGLIRQLAETRGVIVLTDSDGAGFVIRNHLKGSISGLKHAYIPEIQGKERRKIIPSKEGTLGVEGMDRATLITALRRAGATFEDADQDPEHGRITRSDLIMLGLSGGRNSSQLRQRLLARMGLPSKLSSSALADILGGMYSREELEKIVSKMQVEK